MLISHFTTDEQCRASFFLRPFDLPSFLMTTFNYIARLCLISSGMNENDDISRFWLSQLNVDGLLREAAAEAIRGRGEVRRDEEGVQVSERVSQNSESPSFLRSLAHWREDHDRTEGIRHFRHTWPPCTPTRQTSSFRHNSRAFPPWRRRRSHITVAISINRNKSLSWCVVFLKNYAAAPSAKSCCCCCAISSICLHWNFSTAVWPCIVFRFVGTPSALKAHWMGVGMHSFTCSKSLASSILGFNSCYGCCCCWMASSLEFDRPRLYVRPVGLCYVRKLTRKRG